MNEDNRGEYGYRNYNDRGYDDRSYRGYNEMNERNYRGEMNERGYAEGSYRDNVYDMRDYNDRRRDYDRRGGKINNRNYRNYRDQDYYEELEMAMMDIKEQTRKLEDIAEMAHNPQDKNMLMKIAQKEKENYQYIKQMMDK